MKKIMSLLVLFCIAATLQAQSSQPVLKKPVQPGKTIFTLHVAPPVKIAVPAVNAMPKDVAVIPGKRFRVVIPNREYSYYLLYRPTETYPTMRDDREHKKAIVVATL